MKRLKNWIVYKLGGYTAGEYNNNNKKLKDVYAQLDDMTRQCNYWKDQFDTAYDKYCAERNSYITLLGMYNYQCDVISSLRG